MVSPPVGHMAGELRWSSLAALLALSWWPVLTAVGEFSNAQRLRSAKGSRWSPASGMRSMIC